MKEVRLPKPPHLPNNLVIVWHQGDFSIGEIMEKPIIDHYPHGVGRIIEQKRDEKHQLAEDVFRMLFYKAITLATTNKDKWYQYTRMDKEDETTENNNNRPFIMDTSPRYFQGAEVKDIEYEGYQYHSDMSEIRRYP